MVNDFGRPSAASNCTDFDKGSKTRTQALGLLNFVRLKQSVSCVIVQTMSLRDHLLTPIAPIKMNVPKNTNLALGHSNYIRKNQAVSCVTVWLTALEDNLLTPIAPMLMNVTKKKSHALGHSNYVTMK